MGLGLKHLLRFLGACAAASGLMIAQPGIANAQGLTEFLPLKISKTCAGLSGTATLTLSVTRGGDAVGSSFLKEVECGGFVIVLGVPNVAEGGGFEVGDVVTISEASRPNLSILRAPTTTVTLHEATTANPNVVTIADPAAVSIKKTCATGVTGKATFLVTNDSEEASFSIDVACGTTVALPLPNNWDASEDLAIHESVPPTNGVAAADQTVRIPESNGSAQLAEFANTATATASPTPAPPQLAATGDSTGASLALFLIMAAGSALLLLGGLTIWRRRQA